MRMGYVYVCMHRYTYATGQTIYGVRRIPIPNIQAMIACKNCARLVGRRSFGRKVGRSVEWLTYGALPAVYYY